MDPIDFDKLAKQAKAEQEGGTAKPQSANAGGSAPAKRGGVKNKQAASMQITAEQILREALDRQESTIKIPQQKITDLEELQDYRLRKRKEYEDKIRRNRYRMGVWVKYAQWEESQKEFERARSVYERAIDVDPHNVSIWLKYVEMEMKNKFVNHARNLWNRVVAILPRVDQIWYKFAHMEEMLGNTEGAREVYSRWMTWQPEEKAWKSFVHFEMRYNNDEGARHVLEEFVKVHPAVGSWIYYARFEQKTGDPARARAVFERALKVMGNKANDEQFFIAFARFEEQQKEVERARAIYKFALDHIPKHRAQDLYQKFVQFEKQNGDREGIEEVIINKKRFQYEEELKASPANYDVWFDYINLEEEAKNNIERTRDVYERAITNVPPLQEKRFWRRYIYLWIRYAIFEEEVAKDIRRAREVYAKCLKLIPHKLFSFSKVWIMFATFEIRQKNLEAARSILGHAIGSAPKDKIFKEYIKIELALSNVERVRKIFEKYLEYNPSNCNAWRQYADMESKLEQFARARAIYELAVKQPALDMPEVVWKAYIDFEITHKNLDKVRELYEKLLDRTKHVKVWISYAMFEASVGQIDKCRQLFERAEKYFKSGSVEEETPNEETEQMRKEQRVELLESWRDFETKLGTPETQKQIAEKMPKKVKKRRKLKIDGVETTQYEEYYDYIFPTEAGQNSNMKLLQLAYKWKQQSGSTSAAGK